MSRRPLKIGISPRFMHRVPPEMGFPGKSLQYLEQTVAHWLLTAGALVFMVPSIAGDGLLRRGSRERPTCPGQHTPPPRRPAGERRHGAAAPER